MTYITKNKRKWNRRRKDKLNNDNKALTVSIYQYTNIIQAFKNHGFFIKLEKCFIEKFINDILRNSHVIYEAKGKPLEEFKQGVYREVVSNIFSCFCLLRWDNPDRSIANKMNYIASQRSLSLSEVLQNIFASCIYENAKVW